MSSEPTLPRRGRPANPVTRQQRAAQIVAAARRCFLVRGFHAASLSDIAAEAGVSVANIYQYFRAKDDLILALCEQDLAEDLQAIADLRAAPGFVRGLDQAFAQYTTSGAEDLPLRLEILAEALRNPRVGAAVAAAEARIAAALTEAVAEAQTRGELRPDLAPGALAVLLLCLFDGMCARVAAGEMAAAAGLAAVRRLIAGMPDAGGR